MPISAKLTGLDALIRKLKHENPDRWRLVVFTCRRETQTTIQTFLESHDLSVGIINGESGARNQETINRFRQNPPYYRVIVSTEAGSEGVNLQVANVLVNFDLPWNPMIVEQRIGRIQRLASEHAHVSIFNIMLRGTFEEYIVGRLMEKLQMACHAIGDIESLLQGSDVGDGEEDVARSFEDQILELVLAALAGKNVEEETHLKELSIETARAELERSEASINEMLGSSDGAEYVGPRAPKLPVAAHSMQAEEFVQSALQDLGVRLTRHGQEGLYLAEENGSREYIRFHDPGPNDVRSTLYAPGSGAFQNLVGRAIITGIHDVEDLDHDPGKNNEMLVRKWVESFGGKLKSSEIKDARCRFTGSALLRVRVTVAHDSYERLVEVLCSPAQHDNYVGRPALSPLGRTLENPLAVGLDPEQLAVAARNDEGVAEFCRFYLERREQELQRARGDERKRNKLHEDFTPRFQITLVGLQGKMHRDIQITVVYSFDDLDSYQSTITTVPHGGTWTDEPETCLCSVTRRQVPVDCVATCEVSGAKALRHRLVASAVSGRWALPEFTDICSLSGKRVLRDELEISSVTERLCSRTLLKTSALSGKRAEPECFSLCEFSNSEVLKAELAVSEISGKKYRVDEQTTSAVSGKTGHRSEFIHCYETRQLIAVNEAEQCESTGKMVRTGVLEICEITGKRVLPSELLRCAVTGKRAIKSLFVFSSLSHSHLLREVAISSTGGSFCMPAESQPCNWSGQKLHTDDIRNCSLTGLPISFEFTSQGNVPRLRPLLELLNGTRRTEDEATARSEERRVGKE